MNSEETMFSKRDLDVTKDNILSAIGRVLDTHFSSINDLVEENHNYEEIKELIANIPFVKNMNRELIESRITIKQLERELAHAHDSDVEEDDKIKLVVKEVDNSRRKELSINDIRQMDEFTKQDEQLATYNFIGDGEGLEDAKRIRVMPYAMPIGGTPRINFWNNESDDDSEGCYGKEYVSNPVGRMLDVEPTVPVEKCEEEEEEEEEEETDVVIRVEIDNKKYLKSKKSGVIYDASSHEEIGVWNEKTKVIDYYAGDNEEEEYEEYEDE